MTYELLQFIFFLAIILAVLYEMYVKEYWMSNSVGYPKQISFGTIKWYLLHLAWCAVLLPVYYTAHTGSRQTQKVLAVSFYITDFIWRGEAESTINSTLIS